MSFPHISTAPFFQGRLSHQGNDGAGKCVCVLMEFISVYVKGAKDVCGNLCACVIANEIRQDCVRACALAHALIHTLKTKSMFAQRASA